MMERPNTTLGMRHVALFVDDLEACLHFYVDLLGMAVEWQPDPDNYYLTTAGQDNLALHRGPEARSANRDTALDHIGFMLRKIEEVDLWYRFLLENDVKMKTEPRTHRDGARSFYCFDPEGNTVQIIYHPPIANSVQ